VAGEREAVGSRDLLERRCLRLLACVGRDVVARELDGPHVDRDGAAVGPAAECAERIGDHRGNCSPGEVADRLVDVGEQGRYEASRRRRLLDGIGDEGQCAPAERIADEFGCDVEDAVAEALLGSRSPVMRLVGMQDVQLTGQADAARAA
jgi:hypothetical protein